MSTHGKMARSERAKQFMPFAALKGYSEALRRTEEKALYEYDEDERGGAERDAAEGGDLSPDSGETTAI